MDIRKDPLANDQYYHIYSRSISKYIIFNDAEDFNRFLDLLDLYRFTDFYYKYSYFLELKPESQKALKRALSSSEKIVEMIVYSLMPTHIHLILKQVKNNGITKFMAKVLNSYAKYFNAKHFRNGPLFAGKFKDVLISNDEQLLHTSRYLHLNSTSAGIVKDPRDWAYSSLEEYVAPESIERPLCNTDIIDLKGEKYLKFVNDHKDYQRSLSTIKHCLIDDYSG